jgi:hypothetical protein
LEDQEPKTIGFYSKINSPSNLKEFESGLAQKGSVEVIVDGLGLPELTGPCYLTWVAWDLKVYFDALLGPDPPRVSQGWF